MFIKIILVILFVMNCEIYSENLQIKKVFDKKFTYFMKSSEFFNQECLYNKNWKNIQNLFDNFVENIEISKNPIIPKIIHQVWLGSPFPEKYTFFQSTWIKSHPEWRYILWTDEMVEKFGLKNKDLYNKAKNFGEKSDVVRYEVLDRFGGLYIDTDFECIKSFDILHHVCDFYTSIGYGPDPVILCGLIGSVPGHPILRACINNMKRNENEKDSFIDILNRSSIFHFTRCFLKNFTKSSIVFPVTFFYPLPDCARGNYSKNFIKDESFAVHHWHLSWNNGKIGD